MKNDNKVFSIYILIILIYGLSYWITSGKSFAFSPEYSYFGLGLIALGLFFHKKVTKYSFILISLGFSFFYLISSTQGFDLIDSTGFLQLRILSLVVFSLLLLWDLNKSRYSSLKIESALLSFTLLSFYLLQAFDLDFAFSQDFSLYKNGIGFLLVVWMLRKNEIKNSFSTPLKRVVIVIGLSFFIEVMTYFVG